jgi:hypothetical protein
VQAKYDLCVNAGVPVAGLWLQVMHLGAALSVPVLAHSVSGDQDWSGKRVDSFGSRLWWNWVLDSNQWVFRVAFM